METDHIGTFFNKPLRLGRMFLRLQRYDINLVYKTGKELIITDTLSRAHLSDSHGDEM